MLLSRAEPPLSPNGRRVRAAAAGSPRNQLTSRQDDGMAGQSGLDGDQLIGTAALEIYADGALLRSVAVKPRQQGRQLGHQLTDAALQLAANQGAHTVFLLTTTAERFFPKFGFEQIAREQVPASVRGSVEFQSACPASAIVMRKQVR